MATHPYNVVARPHLDKSVQKGPLLDKRGLETLRKAISDNRFEDPFVVLKALISNGQVSATVQRG